MNKRQTFRQSIMYDPYYYEQQQDQAREEYYIMGITAGSNGTAIEFANEEYLTGYKHGLFSVLDSHTDNLALAMSGDEPPF